MRNSIPALLFLGLIVFVFAAGLGGFNGLFALFSKPTKWGFVDPTGKIVIAPRFDGVEGEQVSRPCGWLVTIGPAETVFHEGLAAVRIGKEWGYISKTGNIVIKPQFEAANPFSDGLACVQIGGKCGFIDQSGTIVIPAKFDYNHQRQMVFRSGVANVELDRKWGFIRKSGEYLIKPQFPFAWSFSEGLAPVFDSNSRSATGVITYGSFITTDGQTAFHIDSSKYEMVSAMSGFSEGVVLVGGHLDAKTAESMPKKGPVQLHAGDSICWFVDRTGKKVSDEFRDAADFSEGLAAVRPIGSDKCGYIDHSGRMIVKPMFESAGPFHEGVAPVAVRAIDSDGTKLTFGFIDKSGAWTVPAKYDVAQPFSDGRAVVHIGRSTGTEGFVDKGGTMAIPNRYNFACPFSEGLAAVAIR